MVDLLIMSHPYNSNNNNNITSDQVSSEHGTHTERNSVMLSKDEVLDKLYNLLYSSNYTDIKKNDFIFHMKGLLLKMKLNGLGCLLEKNAESVYGSETLNFINEFLLYHRDCFPNGASTKDGLQLLLDIDAGIYDKTKTSIIREISQEWSNLYYDGSVSAANYITKVKNLIIRTKKYDCEMSEYEMKRRIMASMKKDYHKVKDIILLLNRGKLDVDFEEIYEIITNIYHEKEKEIAITCRFDKDPFARQFFRDKENYKKKKGIYNKRSNEGFAKNVSSNKPVVCYNCRQEGHIRPNCPELKEKEVKIKEIKLFNEREEITRHQVPLGLDWLRKF
ncbi:zinc finger CCHC domain-containing protein SCDLUD_003056 [Saccharomycodes ludwigii]|uniref:zinc finger CCHC domain-containing protein n=1 Tax=Saccharomycodes ludwigii TaxID=36035 RepID=UPI001E8823E5|nr:hypothetical protein SCDLUD_003056 [Saccharomycodes ludwigii]KAH3901559.1 hypothetical protein SCDLUD_003056 [Saccharomycodes ludwigii]